MSEKMSKEVVITNYKNHYLIAALENGKAIELFLKSNDGVEIGDVFVGKVKNIVDNIQAAFVEVSPGIIGYYSLKTNTNHLFAGPSEHKLRVGDEILVQIERGSIKNKAPVLTSKIQLQGKHLVFLGNYHFLGVSKKITSDTMRSRIKALGHRLIEGEPNGVILRTTASEVDEEMIVEEYRKLEVDYNNIMSTYSIRVCFSKIYSKPQNWLEYVHMSNDSDLRVQTDLVNVYESFQTAYDGTGDSFLCEFYNDFSYPLIKLKSLETQINRALSKNVWLRSGASLVIESTEALTAIDVNTSKTEIHKKDDEAFFQINIEAAHEICRQLRLRNISGIVIVDFINMSNEKYEEQLLSELRKIAKDDPVQTNVIDMTPLGLVELTRKRTYRPFHEQIKEIGDE